MPDFLNRYVGIGKETGGYGVDPGSYTFGEVDSETMKDTFDVLVREDMSRPIAAKAVQGKEYSEGDINLALQSDDFVGKVLSGFFPQDVVTTATVKVHTMEEPPLGPYNTSTAYPSFTMVIGREEKSHKFTGLCANSLNISANVGEYVMMTAGFYGKSESAVGNLLTATFDQLSLNAMHFAGGEITFAGGAAVANIKSIDFSINLNGDMDNAYGIGSNTFTRAVPKQRREITGTAEFNQVVYTATANEPTYTELIGGLDDGSPSSGTSAMTLKFVGDTSNEFIQFDFYHLFWDAPDASVSGRDTNTMTAGFTALFNPDSGEDNKAMRCTMKGASLQSTPF
tara:strand:- start:4403 stop:5422 length:1020 start_codon:yes stop_codon:yes gene_type:complete